MTESEINQATERVKTFYNAASMAHQKINKNFFFKEGGYTLFINFAYLKVNEVEKGYYVSENMIAFEINDLSIAEQILQNLGIDNTRERLNTLYYSCFSNTWNSDSGKFWFCIKPV